MHMNTTTSHNPARRVILACITLFLIASTAHAQTTWYVRTSGKNSEAGTSPETALATPAAAISKAKAGDTIYIGAGTYSGRITISLKATASNPLRIFGDITGKETGDPGPVTITASGDVVYVTGNHIRLTDLIINPQNGSKALEWKGVAGGRMTGITVPNGDAPAVLISDGSNITIEASTFTNVYKSAIHAKDSTLTIRTSRFESVGMGIESEKTNLEVTRSEFYNSTDGVKVKEGNGTLSANIFRTISGKAVYNEQANPVFVANNTFYNVSGYGIDSDGGSLTARNNIFHTISGFVMRRTSGTFSASHTLFHNIAGWQTTGFTHTDPIFNTDPKFVSLYTPDLRLAADSPARNAGTDTSSHGMLDYDGVLRPQGGAWDLGAYETLAAGAIPADTPYETAFDGDTGPEWTIDAVTTYGKHGRWLGPFRGDPGNQQPVELHLNVQSGTPYVLLFDLLLIDSWEGSADAPSGPDRFTVDIAGSTLFDETFNNTNTTGDQQSFSTPAHYYGNIGHDPHNDSIYRDIRIDFVPSSSKIAITFASIVTHADERFAIDNIRVAPLDDAFAIIPLFVDHTAQTTFNIPADPAASHAEGWAWADINNNGLLDGLASGNIAAWLFLNNGPDFTVTALHAADYSGQIALLDIDNDGDLDLWTRHHQVFENLGNATFIPAGSWSCGGVSGRSAEAALDINADGLTDIIALATGGAIAGYHMNGVTKFDLAEGPDIGINILGGQGLAATADANNNGRLDIYYSRSTGSLFLSQGDGTFTLDNRGISQTPGHDRLVGAAWADYNNSRRMDLLAPHPDTEGGVALWQNNGPSFTDVASAAGLPLTGRFRSAAWADVNNNGHLDLYLAAELEDEPNALYINNGDGTFTRRDWGTGLYGKAIDATFVDIDNDGDLDLVLTFETGQTRLLRNTLNDARSLSVQVTGRGQGGTSTDAVGVRVDLIEPNTQTLIARRTIGNARGFGTEPFRAHFGGVDPATPYTVRVHFRSGHHDTTVIPNQVSTTFGARTVQRLLVVTEPPPAPRMVRWVEEAP